MTDSNQQPVNNQPSKAEQFREGVWEFLIEAWEWLGPFAMLGVFLFGLAVISFLLKLVGVTF